MNQILVTEKLYVTPELKRKRKFYKVSFILSIFAIIALASFYVYAEYDKARSENISQDILSEMSAKTETIAEEEETEEDKVWKIIISTVEQDEAQIDEEITSLSQLQEVEINNEKEEKSVFTASDGKQYETIGSVKIPKLNLNYPILSETSVALLKISPCRFYGPEKANEVGNLCIAGHNYKNEQFFSKVPELVVGDIIEITDVNGKTVKYSVYDKYTVVPDDTNCTNQNTNGKRIITLITCTNDNKKRVIVHAKEII